MFWCIIRGTMVRTNNIRSQAFSQICPISGRDTNPGGTSVYPPGLKMVSGNADATSAQPGHRNHREIFFRCYRPGTGGNNSINTKHSTIPSCGSDRRLEMNIKFQTCWNGKNPADYKRNVAYSDVWPTSGSCPSSHPIKLPQLEYRVLLQLSCRIKSMDFIVGC